MIAVGNDPANLDAQAGGVLPHGFWQRVLTAKTPASCRILRLSAVDATRLEHWYPRGLDLERGSMGIDSPVTIF